MTEQELKELCRANGVSFIPHHECGICGQSTGWYLFERWPPYEVAYSSSCGCGDSDADPFAPRHSFKYDADRAEQTVAFWRQQLAQGSPLFHVCFQVYQTAMQNYYPSVYPLLFGGSSSKSDPLHTALTGETDTINAVMKYQGYSSPEQVYNTELPIILGTLNTMSKEAKEIEKMNAKIKRKG